MSNQGKRLIQLMFSDSQAKKFLVKSDELFCQWRNFSPTGIYADFFYSNKVFP